MKKLIDMMTIRHDFYTKNPHLGAQELHLLEEVAIAEYSNSPLSVSAAMNLKAVASPATVWRCLDKLIKSNYIYQKQGANDTRVKQIMLSQRGRQYFKKVQAVL